MKQVSAVSRVALTISTPVGSACASSANRLRQVRILSTSGFPRRFSSWSACQCIRPPVGCMSNPTSTTRVAPNRSASATEQNPLLPPSRMTPGRADIPPPGSVAMKFKRMTFAA